MKKLYIDNTHQGDGPIGILAKDSEVVYTGTIINSAPVKMRGEEIVQDAARCDVWFFFDDDHITLELYTVPFAESFAWDGCGGFFVKEQEMDAPVYYIGPDRRVGRAADNFESFLRDLKIWKENLQPASSLKAFSSREEAQRVYQIYDMEELIANRW